MLDYDSNYVELENGKRVEKENFFEAKVLRNLTKESEKYPLLTREQEQAFIRQYQSKRNALYALAQATYGKEKYPNPSSWNSLPEQAVIKAIVNPKGSHYDEGARIAREKMVLHNLRLLKRYGKTQKTGDLGPFELYANGISGLLHALDKFDSTKTNGNGQPNKFSTYAVWWIKQNVRRSVVDGGRTIRIPIHVHDQIAKLGKIYAQLSSEYYDSPSPTAEQLSQASGIPVDQVKLMGMYRADFSITSLDRETFAGDEDDSGTLLDSMGAPESLEPDNVVEKSANKEALDKLMERALAPDDVSFAKWYFGLLDGQNRTVREAASVFQVPRKDIQLRVDNILLLLQQHGKREEFNMEDEAPDLL